MSVSYEDFENEYNGHLSKVRSFLAQPSDATNHATFQCEEFLKCAKQCISAMQGLAEVEGDPFKAEEAKRKLEREISPLESELKARKGSTGGGKTFFKRPNNTSNSQSASIGERYLFNNRPSYAPPTMAANGDLESNADSFAAPVTALEQRMQESEDLLRETQALCAESEQIGAGTLETMGRQREQIERSGNMIQQSLENTEQARQIMKEMASRALRNKMFLYSVIAVLILANGAVLVHLWRRKK
mmetsp:Transcript_20151/g.47371  ORF Transcript_20151/g.47371 Transcript_20151/m.47371 type:complete len:245 (+) Transcript_20151:42-776(+)